MKKLREILGEKFSKEMETWLQNNKITRNMKAREPAEAPAKKPSVMDKYYTDGKFNKDRFDNDMNVKMQSLKSVDASQGVDFTGSRHSAGPGDVKVVDDSLNKNWRSKSEKIGSYQQPPGYGTPSFEKAKERMAAADTVGNEPPMPGAGPYKTKQSDPLKTTPIIVTADKPMLSKDPAVIAALGKKGYDPTGKKVTAIPKQTGVGRAETPLPSNTKLPSGPGITTTGSFTYSEPEKKPKQITDRVPPSKLYTDRVPQTKQIIDRVPQEPTVASKAMGPFTISKDDPNSLRYQKVADLSKYAPRTRTKPEPEVKQLDNTKGAVPIPKPDSVGINVKFSNKKAVSDQSTRKIQKGETFWDIAGGNPEEVKRLKKLNPNINPSKLQIGQEIKLK